LAGGYALDDIGVVLLQLNAGLKMRHFNLEDLQRHFTIKDDFKMISRFQDYHGDLQSLVRYDVDLAVLWT